MIKLIVSDIDGTLVPEGAGTIDEQYYDMIRELKKRNILFAAASGRQYPSMSRLFEPVKDQVIFIAENGAYVVCRDTQMSLVPMNREYVEQLVKEMREHTDCMLTISGKEATYTESRDEQFLDLLVNGYHNTVEIVEDVLAVDTTVIKMALYNKNGIQNETEEFMKRWQDKVKVLVAGSLWLDFIDLSVDKGNALSKIQQLTGIAKEETICFGDNKNDVAMFQQAGQSYAVASASKEVQREASCVIGTYEENSVLQVIRKKLETDMA